MKGDTMYIQICTNTEEIISVIHQAFKRYETDLIPSSALVETADSLQNELHKGLLIFGVYDQEQLVAVVKCEQKQNSLYFSRLAVLPAYLGKGMARALIQCIEQYAVQKQLSAVMCKVRKSEEGNIRLYEKLGYIIVSEEMTVSKTGKSIPTVTMVKQVLTT